MKNALIIFCLLLVCIHSSHGADYWPSSNDAWQSTTITEAGVDPILFQEAVDFAGEKNTKALVVLWKGKILTESYWDDWNRMTRSRLYSASKSYLSSLVGIAIEEGSIGSVTDPSYLYLPEWRGDPEKEAITIEHQLSMTTGLEEFGRNLLRMNFSNDERAFAAGLPITSPPGSNWYYNNPGYRLLFYVLEEATGQSLPQYTRSRLLEPLGMTHTEWETRTRLANGQSIQNYQFLVSNALDAARFGLMILRGGEWDGRQILSPDWIRQATTATYPDINPSYGYLWWLNGGDFHYRPLDEVKRKGSIAPDGPADAYGALGKDDQKIYIVPSLDLVIVRLGDAAQAGQPAVSDFDNQLLHKVTSAFGLDPTSGGDAAFAEIALEMGVLRLSYNRLREDVSYVVETSTDLVHWSSDGVDQGASELGPVEASVQISSSESRFLRIRVITFGSQDTERTLSTPDTRSYLLHLPAGYDSNQWYPVVLAFHGGGGNAESMRRISGWNAKADQEGFIVAYPNGSGPDGKLSFNAGGCCGFAMQTGVDDIAFVNALLDDLIMNFRVDPSRVYAIGLSNGGIMSYYAASQLPDRFAAIASVAGSNRVDSCHPSQPVPVMHLHGTADTFLPFEGGFGISGNTDFASVEETLNCWITTNSSNPQPIVEALPDTAQDACNVERYAYPATPGGAEVILIKINNGGHTWPGSDHNPAQLGNVCFDINANDVIWDFFQRHQKARFGF